MMHLVLGKNRKGKYCSFIRTAENAEAGAVIGTASKAVDFNVVRPEALGAVSGPELVAIFNSLMRKPADRVKRFENSAAGVRRVLSAIESSQADLAAEPAAKAQVPRKAPTKGAARRRILNGAPETTRIALLACPAGKRWQAGSARKAVYEWLAAHPDSTVAAVLAHSGVPQSKVPGCLGKLVTDGLIELKTA